MVVLIVSDRLGCRVLREYNSREEAEKDRCYWERFFLYSRIVIVPAEIDVAAQHRLSVSDAIA